MKQIVYYVASSLDGFISGPNGEVEGFIMQGESVDHYRAELKFFNTVIMGRTTYESGYRCGLQPGQPVYPHMDHYIFSGTLKFDNPAEKVHVKKLSLDAITELKENSKTDIYLCGGGMFAGWLLNNGLIDILKIKLNPLILGNGIKLFANCDRLHVPVLIDNSSFDDGIQILTYKFTK